MLEGVKNALSIHQMTGNFLRKNMNVIIMLKEDWMHSKTANLFNMNHVKCESSNLEPQDVFLMLILKPCYTKHRKYATLNKSPIHFFRVQLEAFPLLHNKREIGTVKPQRLPFHQKEHLNCTIQQYCFN